MFPLPQDSCDVMDLCKLYLNGLDPVKELEHLINSSKSTENNAGIGIPKGLTHVNQLNQRKDMIMAPIIGAAPYKMNYGPSNRGGGNRGGFSNMTRNVMLQNTGRGLYDPFRSRPPNTSRPPSLHVDDFEAMESGQMSTASPVFSKAPARTPMDSYSNRGRMSQPSRQPYASIEKPHMNMNNRNPQISMQDSFYQMPVQRADSISQRGRFVVHCCLKIHFIFTIRI